MTATKLDNSVKKLAAGLAALGLLAAVASPARAASEHTSLAIPFHGIQFLSEYVADDMHLWEQQDLDVKVTLIAGVGSMNAVIAGACYEVVRDMTAQPPAPSEAGLANADRMNIIAGFIKPEDTVKSYTALFTAEFAR